MGSRAGAGNKAVRDCLHSKADLLEVEWGGEEKEKRRGEMRKIINPPNMGTKSDPMIKINDSRKKKELPPSLSSLPGCLPPSAAVARSSSEAALPPSKIKKGEEAELAPPTNSTIKYGIMCASKRNCFSCFYSLIGCCWGEQDYTGIN